MTCAVSVRAGLEQMCDTLGHDADEEYLTDCLVHFEFDAARAIGWVLDHPGQTRLPPLPSSAMHAAMHAFTRAGTAALTAALPSQGQCAM